MGAKNKNMEAESRGKPVFCHGLWLSSDHILTETGTSACESYVAVAMSSSTEGELGL